MNDTPMNPSGNGMGSATGNGNTRTFHDAVVFSELEQQLENIQSLSDEQLIALKQRFGTQVKQTQKTDLHAYRQEQEERQKEQLSENYTLLERVGHFFGFTPKRRFASDLKRAESLHGVYERSCKNLQEYVDEKSDELIALSQEHTNAKGYFEACQAHYARQRERVDHLEAEIEVGQRQAGDRLSLVVSERREQLITARKELRSLSHEADTAMRMYITSTHTYESLDAHTKELSERLSSFESQRAAFGVLLSKWQVEQTLTVGNRGPSMRELYEDIGIQSQHMQESLRKFSAHNPEQGVDKTYAITKANTADPLVSRWLSVRE